MRMKGEIISIGTIDENDHPKDWVFNGLGKVPMIEITEDDTLLWCGYTLEELMVIKDEE